MYAVCRSWSSSCTCRCSSFRSSMSEVRSSQIASRAVHLCVRLSTLVCNLSTTICSRSMYCASVRTGSVGIAEDGTSGTARVGLAGRLGAAMVFSPGHPLQIGERTSRQRIVHTQPAQGLVGIREDGEGLG